MEKKKKEVKIKRERKKEGELTIKRKLLNNKSRKGWHYYIKEAKKKPAYYKIHEGVDIENYLLAYQGKVKIKKRGVLQYTKESPAEKYLRKVEKSKKIEDLISVGITESDIGDLRFTGKKNMHEAYKKMLKPLVKDKELLNILALEENVRKFKHRLQTTIVMSSEDGRVEIAIKTFNKDLAEIKNDFKEITTKKDIQETDLQEILKKGYKLEGIPKGVDITGSKYHVIASKLGKIKIKIKFVKGK